MIQRVSYSYMGRVVSEDCIRYRKPKIGSKDVYPIVCSCKQKMVRMCESGHDFKYGGKK